MTSTAAADLAMPMTWMRMPGQTWPGAAASFVGMWDLMMVAMMLPSLAPALWRYHRWTAGVGATRPALLTAVAGAGYCFAWTVVGAAVFPLGALLADAELHVPTLARVTPFAVGVVVLVAGLWQRTSWKARLLARCHHAPARHHQRASAGAAWEHGLRLGVHCVRCCANLTAILLVVGVMDVRAMAVVGVAGAAERLTPSSGERVARATGAAGIGVGLLLLIVRAAGLAG